MKPTLLTALAITGLAAVTIPGAVAAVTANRSAYIGCAVWANGNRLTKHYAYGQCSTHARIG